MTKAFQIIRGLPENTDIATPFAWDGFSNIL